MNRVTGGSAQGVSPLAPQAGGFPDPVLVRNASGKGRFVLVCEHASNALPERFGGLGLSASDLSAHIAWDIGAAALTGRLSALLDAPAVLAGYSRLLCDVNRPPGAADSICAVSDGRAVPGNAALDETARQRRADGLYHPFHDALERILARKEGAALVSIHSFTPVFGGRARAMHAGVLFEGDNPFARSLARALAREEGLDCRINEPYGPDDGVLHTLRRHGAGRDTAMIEVRNDLIGDKAGQERWARLLADKLKEAERRDGQDEKRR